MDPSFPFLVGGALFALPALLYVRHRRSTRARKTLFDTPLPPYARAVLRARVPLSRNLSEVQRKRLEGLVQLFLAEKTFIGCRALNVNEVMKVTVAGHACLLLLGQDAMDVYPDLSTIFLYPSTYVRRDEWALDGGVVVREEGAAFDGESWDQSCVVLSLKAIREGVRDFDGFNVVIHEFAHQFDSLSGDSNGCPPMSKALHQRWAPAMRKAWDALVEDDRRGRETYLDPYGAQSPTEFFAVLTEEFFECPHGLEKEHPELFTLLQELYGIDPREWHAEANPS